MSGSIEKILDANDESFLIVCGTTGGKYCVQLLHGDAEKDARTVCEFTGETIGEAVENLETYIDRRVDEEFGNAFWEAEEDE